jgi:hypothetical protein
MSSHVSSFSEESEGEEFFSVAKEHWLIGGFEEHPCSAHLIAHLPVMQEREVNYTVD